MEIYRLTDEVTKNTELSDEVRKKDGVTLKITAMKQGLKNPNRVNIYVNGNFEFSLEIAQVVELGIKSGSIITNNELMKYRWASEFGKLYQRALEWVLIRPRSKKEMRDYLNRKVYEKQLDKDYVDMVMRRLEERKYLDDLKFANWWTENRFVKKGISQKRLRMELVKKGIERKMIEEVLSRRDDEEEARKMIIKKRKKYDDDRLMAYLSRQGFAYDLVYKLVKEVEETEDTNTN